MPPVAWPLPAWNISRRAHRRRGVGRHGGVPVHGAEGVAEQLALVGDAPPAAGVDVLRHRAVEVEDRPLRVVGRLVGGHDVMVLTRLLEAKVPDLVAVFQVNVQPGVERRVDRAVLCGGVGVDSVRAVPDQVGQVGEVGGCHFERDVDVDVRVGRVAVGHHVLVSHAATGSTRRAGGGRSS